MTYKPPQQCSLSHQTAKQLCVNYWKWIKNAKFNDTPRCHRKRSSPCLLVTMWLIKDPPKMLMQPCEIHFSSLNPVQSYLALNVSIICESNENDAASNSTELQRHIPDRSWCLFSAPHAFTIKRKLMPCCANHGPFILQLGLWQWLVDPATEKDINTET